MMSLSEVQRVTTDMVRYADSLVKEDKYPANIPGSTVKGVVFRNVYVGDIETYRDIDVTLDQYGIHGTCVLNGETVVLTRLNQSLDYSFDAPDTVCPINAKDLYTMFSKRDSIG